jgi:hypothetical protein
MMIHIYPLLLFCEVHIILNHLIPLRLPYYVHMYLCLVIVDFTKKKPH